MLRYRPPKSSVWGHGLRRMPISRVHSLFHRFLDEAAAELRFATANVWSNGANSNIIERYEALAEKPAVSGRIANVGQVQSKRCFAQLLQDEQEFRSGDVHLSLWQEYEVIKCKGPPSGQATPSRLIIHYDLYPHLGTTLQFESLAQFQFVSRVLQSVGLCTLNPKHLKAVRLTAQLPAGDA